MSSEVRTKVFAGCCKNERRAACNSKGELRCVEGKGGKNFKGVGEVDSCLPRSPSVDLELAVAASGSRHNHSVPDLDVRSVLAEVQRISEYGSGILPQHGWSQAIPIESKKEEPGERLRLIKSTAEKRGFHHVTIPYRLLPKGVPAATASIAELEWNALVSFISPIPAVVHNIPPVLRHMSIRAPRLTESPPAKLHLASPPPAPHDLEEIPPATPACTARSQTASPGHGNAPRLRCAPRAHRRRTVGRGRHFAHLLSRPARVTEAETPSRHPRPDDPGQLCNPRTPLDLSGGGPRQRNPSLPGPPSAPLSRRRI
ncbi:hypothetical protein JHW43_001208 [Diplocarpon mali]|nr:hypothetical protein JHW43_001208 [Diplocarpon mali]